MDLPRRLGFLFGTEEYVSMRKELVLLRENLMHIGRNKKNVRFICSGSFGEAIDYPSSDDDVMMYSTSVRVVKTYREATQWGDLLMVPSQYSPGYCLLLDVTQAYCDDYLQIIDGKPFLSSSLWKLLDMGTEESIHGPCRTRNLGIYEYDTAYCIACSFWPDIANDWLTRNRSHGWPSPEIIQNIIGHDCHVVPIGEQNSAFCQHEWRISFSVAERTLMHSFNHSQFLTYNLLRFALKRVIEKEAPGVLCSYFMKTTLFYTSEKNSIEGWQGNNIGTGFKACLSLLYDYVDHRYCPNYFIPEYNMMKRKVNHTNRNQLLDIIRTLYSAGIAGTLQLCRQSICLDERLSLSTIEWKLDRDAMVSSHINFTLPWLLSRCLLVSRREKESCTLCLRYIMRFRQDCSTACNLLFQRGFAFYCQILMHRLWSEPKQNKVYYNLNKNIQSLLRIEYNVDLATGKLTMATYMFMVGKTESALSHIQRMLSEYPPYGIDKAPSDIQRTAYIDVMCSRGYTIDYKARHAFAPFYRLDIEVLHAYPLPFRIWICMTEHINLDPLSYSYVLESLCYIRLRNYSSFLKSTRCLRDHIDGMKFDPDIVDGRICMGIIKSVQGDYHSGFRWLGSALIMKNAFPRCYQEKLTRSILTHMSYILSKRLNG